MRILLVFFILGNALVSCKQSVKGDNGVRYSSAVEYNDYIVERQTELMKNVLVFGNMNDSAVRYAADSLQRYALQAGRMIEELKGMPPYKGDSAFRDAAVRSFSFYKRIFENDYVDLIRIRQKGADNITEEDVEAANKIIDKIGREEEEYDRIFRNAQEEYARRNKMILTENEIEKEIEKLDQQ